MVLGRLQTERDKARVIEGLEGASAQAGATFNRQEMEAALAALGNRVFLMNNVHDDEPVVFQIAVGDVVPLRPAHANADQNADGPGAVEVPSHRRPKRMVATADGTHRFSGAVPRSKPPPSSRPVVPAGIREKFLAINDRVPDGYRLEYRPGLLGKGKVHFVRKADGIDVWRDVLPAAIDQRRTARRHLARRADRCSRPPRPRTSPTTAASSLDLPAELSRDKSYAIFARQLKEHLYREESLKLWQCEMLDATSKPDEQEADFRNRLAPMLDRTPGRRAATSSKSRMSPKLAKLETQIQSAQTKAQHAPLAVLCEARHDAVGRRRYDHGSDGQEPAGAASLARSGDSLDGDRDRPAIERQGRVG